MNCCCCVCVESVDGMVSVYPGIYNLSNIAQQRSTNRVLVLGYPEMHLEYH